MPSATGSKGKFSLRSAPAASSPNAPAASSSSKQTRFAGSKRIRSSGGATGYESDDVEEEDGAAADSEEMTDDEAGDSTEDEIEAAKQGAAAGAKAKGKTSKRKRRAVSPTAFGEALDAFLGADQEDSEDETKGISSDPVQTEAAEKPERSAAAKVATSSSTAPIFSLAPSVRSRISSASLSAKAARVALEERRAREARWRVKDVIGAWGQPGQRPGEDDEADETEESTSALDWQQQGGTKGYERKLRKVAQRGVVKLFNAIRAAQSTTRDDLPDSAPARDSGAAAAKAKSGLASAAADRDGGNVAGRNALGGKSRELAELSKANFLDLIRTSGGSASGRATATAR